MAILESLIPWITNIVELKGVKKVTQAEHLTYQDQADSVLPSSIDHDLPKDLLDYEEGRIEPQLEGATSIPPPAAQLQKTATGLDKPLALPREGATSRPPPKVSSKEGKSCPNRGERHVLEVPTYEKRKEPPVASRTRSRIKPKEHK